MKLFTFFLCSIFPLSVFSQSTKKYVKIDKVNNSVLYFNGPVNIATITFTEPPNPLLTLDPVEVIKDDAGYTTTLTFHNPKHHVINDVDVLLKFNKPFSSVDFRCGVGMSVTESYNSKKTEFRFTAGQLITQDIMQIVIKSSEPIATRITGLNFVYN